VTATGLARGDLILCSGHPFAPLSFSFASNLDILCRSLNLLIVVAFSPSFSLAGACAQAMNASIRSRPCSAGRPARAQNGQEAEARGFAGPWMAENWVWCKAPRGSSFPAASAGKGFFEVFRHRVPPAFSYSESLPRFGLAPNLNSARPMVFSSFLTRRFSASS
jgi:hypothetical protein